jgi:8-oxo-dGTP diphosphatase
MSKLQQLTENVKLLQKAVLVHRGKILLLKRSESAKTRADQWDLPGGNSEWPQEKEGIIRDIHLVDLKREILEETNIGAEQLANAPQLVSFETCFEVERNVYSVIVGWRVELVDSFEKESVSISGEHSQYRWVSPDEISSYDFGFAGEGEGFITRIIENASRM